MSVKRSVNIVNQLRVDTNDLRSIESSVRNDFDELLRAFVTGQNTDQAYILRGFEVNMSGAIGNTANSLSLIVADSAILNGTASVGGTFYLVPSDQSPEILSPLVNQKVNGSFTANTYNYISLDYTRTAASSTSAPRALWDPVNKTEFSKTLPLAEILNYKINITTGAFSANSLPIAIIKTSPENKVLEITDKRPQLFRLGKSGLNANDSAYSYGWNHDTEGRAENPSTASSLDSVPLNPFKGGDKQIQNLKEWMDAVMTEIKLMKGSSFWYSDGSSLVSGLNLTNIFTDALATVMTGKGKFSHSQVSPGVLAWNSDIFLKNIMSNLDITIKPSSLLLQDNQVAYLALERNELFQSNNVFTFTNGSTLVTAITTIINIFPGDFIKPDTAPQSKWHKVLSVSGTQITLSSPYSGTAFTGSAVRTKGTYTSVSIADRASVPNSADVYWLAFRNDNAVPSISISTASRTSNVSTYVTVSAHSLIEGQDISINGVSDSSFDGIFKVISAFGSTFIVENSGLDASATGGSISSLATIYIRDLGELIQGEEIQIDDQTVLNVLEYIGSPTESDTLPVYAYNNYVTDGENLTNAISTLDKSLSDEVAILTDYVTDHQEDRSAFLRSNDMVEFSGGNLLLLSDIVLEILNTSVGTKTSHTIQLANTPIAIANNESIWVIINRNATSENLTLKRTSVDPLPAVSYADKDVFVLFTRIDAMGDSYIHIPLHKQVIMPDQPTRLGASGGNGTGSIKVDYIDPVSLSLPTGSTATIDGNPGVNGDLVLFTNLLTNNNRVYKLGGVGTSITWTMVKAFNYKYPPQDGDAVRIKKGYSHADQLALFNGTSFKINDVVRYYDFDGTSSNYWEQSSLKTTALLDNSTGTIFSTAVYGSENIVVDYSITRDSSKETGQIFITSDGTNVSLSQNNSYLGDVGIAISAQISGSNLLVLYTSTSTGFNAQIKYSIKRWADGLGGPTGIPSYSGSNIGGGTAAGADKQIQFNVSGNLAGDSKFQWDYINRNLVLNGLVFDVLSSPYTLNDNQSVPAAIISYNAAQFRFAVLEYSIERDTSFRTGRLLIANNGTISTISDDFVETALSGVTFSVTMSGGNVNLNYTTTSTGSSSTFKFSARRWN